MKNLSGKILFLDRSDINTDEIIPAKYLTESTKEALKPHCLEDLSLDGFDPKKSIDGNSVIVTRSNFGCGSSREHAPWVLECNGINLVIAESFARIFRQNMFNCGMMAISLSAADIDDIFKSFTEFDKEVGYPKRVNDYDQISKILAEAECETDLENQTFRISGRGKTKTYKFEINAFDLALVKAGGWLDYADKKY